MPTSYTVPQVQVFQEFNTVPSEITDPLRAHISGAHAYLLRYADSSEKILGLLGDYDPIVAHDYSWPHRPAGAKVDQGYTKLFIDDANLEYFTDLIGVDDTVAPVSGKANQVRIDDATYGFKANGDTYPRFPLLYDRDVRPGDRVHIRGVASSVQYSLDTYVREILADQTTPVTGTGTADAANGTTRAASSVITQTEGDTTCNDLAASLTGYSAYGDGYIDDTYTVRVTGSSIDGDLQTATLRITSASGQDDDLVVIPAAIDDYFTVGVRGLQLKFTCSGHVNASLSTDDLIVGQVWTVVVHDDYKVVTGTSAGTYAGVRDTTYIVEVTRGALFADTLKPQVTITTTTGVDVSGPTTVTALGSAVTVGTKGVTITFSASSGTGLRKGEKFYITVTAAADGRFGTLVLGHSLPTEIQDATDLDLRLSIRSNIEITAHRDGFEPLTNWDQSATQVTVNDGIVAYDATFTDSGVPVALDVTSGSVYVEYRAWRSELVSDVGALSDVGDIDAISGPLSPDNPLKWGVYKALSNSNGTAVKYTAVADPDDIDAWQDVIALLVGRSDVYDLVPLTQDRTIQDLFAAHCDTQSSAEAGRWRRVFVSLPAAPTGVVVDATKTSDSDVVLATIADDADTSGTQYTIVSATSGNSDFLTLGVRAGDTVRARYSTAWGVETYEEYVVDAVVSEDQIRLASGPAAAVSVAARIEIWRTLTKNEQAAEIGARAGSFGTRRVCAIWPDTFGSGGTQMLGYYMCCMLAGLRSGVVPHQGLTNLEIQGADDLARTTKYFNSDQLDVMAGDGVWIVTQDPDGTVKSRHAVTTDNSDVNQREEMVGANLDSISYLFLNRLEPFIGVTNVTPTALARLHVELIGVIEFLKASGFTQSLGSQMIDGAIRQLRAHALLKDRVVAVIDVTLPYPLNVFECHLVV